MTIAPNRTYQSSLRNNISTEPVRSTAKEMIKTLSKFYPAGDATKAVASALSIRPYLSNPYRHAEQECEQLHLKREQATTPPIVPFNTEQWEKEWEGRKLLTQEKERRAVEKLKSRALGLAAKYTTR